MESKFHTHLEKALKNVEKDRKIAGELLRDVAEYIGSNKERHKDVGNVAAKYLETLQRSNEQLVKLTSMLQKMRADDYGDLDDKEKEDLFKSFEEDS